MVGDGPPVVSLELHAHDQAGQEVPLSIWPARPCKLSPYLKPGDGVLDIGANVGQLARDFAERAGPDGFVLAVEPDMFTATMCAMLASEVPQIQVLPVAVAEANGVRVLHLDAENVRRHSLWRGNLTTDSPSTRLVPTLTLDDLARRVPKLAAIKVDTQGAEFAVLGGGQATLNRHGLTWCVELWPQGLARAGSSVRQVVDTFAGFGWHPVDQPWSAVLDLFEARPEATQDVILQRRG